VLIKPLIILLKNAEDDGLSSNMTGGRAGRLLWIPLIGFSARFSPTSATQGKGRHYKAVDGLEYQYGNSARRASTSSTPSK